MNIQLNNHLNVRDLGNGLILCRTIAADAEAVAEFNSRIHSDDGFDKPDERLAAWTRDLIAHPHPTFHANDCTLVVEATSGKIVSSMNLISQTWAYEGIPFGVGRFSADVWANRALFDLDWSGGAPPEKVFKVDPFTEKWGQNWGIPNYH